MFDEHTTLNPTEMERALLGCVLIGGVDALTQCDGLVTPFDFFEPRNGWVWSAFLRLAENGSEIDNLTVSDQLKLVGKLDSMGGDAYITELITNIPSSLAVTHYAEAVKRDSVRRGVLKLMTTTISEVMQGEKGIGDIRDELISKLTGLDNPTPELPFSKLLGNYLDAREQLWDNPERQNGISWGYPFMDKAFGTIKPQQLVIVAGVAKGGKSALLANAILRWLKQGLRVGLASLEMSSFEILDRLTHIVTGVDFDEALEHRNARDWNAMMKFWGDLSKMKLHISDKPLKIEGVASLIRTWERQARERIDVFVPDYAGIIIPKDAGKRASAWEQLNEIAVQLKRVAVELNIPIVTAWQLNRGAYDTAKIPTLAELGGSIGAGQHANTVLGINRPLNKAEGQMDIHGLALRSKAGGGVVSLVQKGMALHEIIHTSERGF